MQFYLYALPVLVLAALLAAVIWRPRETAEGARWMRDSFASWFVTSWMYMVGWTIVFTAFSVLLYLDGHFSYNLAVGSSIAPAAFMAMGWAFRFFAAMFLMASERAKQQARAERDDWPEPEYTKLGFLKLRKKQEWERAGKVWRRAGFALSLLVCLHAIGIGLEALDSKRDMVLAGQERGEILIAGNETRIADLEKEIADLETERDGVIEDYTAEIRQYITDGKNNDELADDTRALRETAREEYKADIAALRDELRELRLEGTDTQVSVSDDTAGDNEWAPIFVGLAQLATWSQEPSNWIIYLCAVGFIIFWVLNAEAIVIFIPKELYKMHLKDAENAKDVRRTEIPDDMTAEEWDEMQAAYEEKQRRMKGAKKGARTRRVRRKIEASNEYMDGYINELLAELRDGKSLETILQDRGITRAVLQATLQPHVSEEEWAEIFMAGSLNGKGNDHAGDNAGA